MPSRWLAGGALVAAIALGGCNILGPATYLVAGKPKVPARYELLDQPTLVFVDDRSNAIPLNATQVRRTIADHVATDLMKQEILTDTISSGDAMALARQYDRDGELLSIESLGEATGAAQVIYVEMLRFAGSPDGTTPRPIAACRVKVIDVANHIRLFPPPEDESGWHDVSVLSPPVSPERYRSTTGRRQIETMLAVLVGDQVAKVFYEHVPDDIGSRLSPR